MRLMPILIFVAFSLNGLLCNAAVALDIRAFDDFLLKLSGSENFYFAPTQIQSAETVPVIKAGSTPIKIRRDVLPNNSKQHDAIFLAQNLLIPGMGEPRPVKTLKVQPDGKVIYPNAMNAILIEEPPGGVGDPKRTMGRVNWKLETARSTLSKSSEIIAKATIDLSGAGLSASVVFSRNRDQSSTNTHLIEITMTPSTENPNGKVQDISLPELRVDEKTRGTSLAGIAVPVADNVFLIGLSGLPADVQRNIDLLHNRSWFKVPLRYSNGKRALLMFEKEEPETSSLNYAIAAWVDDEKCGPLLKDEIIHLTSNPNDVVSQLNRNGVINSSLSSKILISLMSGFEKPIQRGNYLIRACASITDIYETISNGPGIFTSLSIPDGSTSEKIADILKSDPELAGDIKAVPKEGTLLPETYIFARGMTRSQMLDHMAQDQQKLIRELWAKRSPDLPISSPLDLVTLASIIEKETALPEERPRLAAVLINRLRLKIPLQSDPTVVYGLVGGRGSLGRNILRNELQQATPYNTYLILGLPVGPITNPGRAALMAAANPLETRELYYVADGTGKNLFSETLEQHQTNVQLAIARLGKLEQSQIEVGNGNPP